MAIEQADFELIQQLRLRESRQEAENGNAIASSGDKKLAILGDCHFHYPVAINTSQNKTQNNVNNRALFCQQAGFEKPDTFDINGEPAFKVNLNEPLADTFNNRYDWVIDSGTLYCCFDIATVWRNIIGLVKMQGVVMHTSNLVGFFGRGFYSLSPSLFYEFYEANGFSIEFMATRTRTNGAAWLPMEPGHNYLASADPKAMQFTDDPRVPYSPQVPNDTLMCCVARKVEEVPFTKPVPQHFVMTKGR